MYKAVFFDLDDTLLDVLACHLEADRYVLEKHGVNYEEAVKRTKSYNFFGMRIKDILRIRRDAMGLNDETLPIHILESERDEYILGQIKEKTSLLPGALEALEYCRENKSLVVIVSSERKKYILKCIEVFGLAKYINLIVSGEEVDNGKPHPDCYLKAFEMVSANIKLDKTECLVVEDSDNGIIAAKKAGLPVCFVPSHNAVSSSKPEYILKTLKEFKIIPLAEYK